MATGAPGPGDGDPGSGTSGPVRGASSVPPAGVTPTEPPGERPTPARGAQEGRRFADPPTGPGPTPAPAAAARRVTGSTGAGTRDDGPRTTKDAWAWLVIAALGFLAGQLASAVVVEVVAATTGHLHDVSALVARAEPPAWVVVSELVGLWAGFVAAAVVASRTRGSGSLRRDMGLAVRGWDLVTGPVVGLAGQVLLLPVLYFPLRRVVPHLDERLRQPAKHLTGGFPGADLAVVAVLTVVVVPLVEELFFRGLVQRALVRVLHRAGHVVGPVLAVVTTGVVFGLAHFEALELLGLATFGVVLAVMAYRLRRLGPCILAHATFNLVAILSVAYPTGVLHGP